MFREAKKCRGRFVSDDGAAVNVSVTKTWGGTDPFEVIFMKFSENAVHPNVIQRVVLDWTENNQAQGQNEGLHGEGNFTEPRIKDMRMTAHPYDFTSAGGQNHINMDFVIREFRFVKSSFIQLISYHILMFFRFPKSPGELLADPELRLIYTSTYKFSGLEGSLALSVEVKEASGDTHFSKDYKQEDQTERKFGVTFHKDSKYDKRSLIYNLDLFLSL